MSVAAFGEKVLYKPSKTVRLAKDEPRWLHRIWLGILYDSNEHIIGTADGVIKCRAITALEENKKFCREDLEKIRGVPWQPVPGIYSNRIPTKIRAQGETDDEDGREDVDAEAEEFEVQVQN